MRNEVEKAEAHSHSPAPGANRTDRDRAIEEHGLRDPGSWEDQE